MLRSWDVHTLCCRLSATAKLADWFARLSDVAPDGTVTQITGAGLNGAQRDSMSEPRDLEPDKVYSLDIEMHLTSWVFPKGHRIRVAISNALWPMVLPTPYAMTTSLELGGERRVAARAAGRAVHGTPAPEFSPPQPTEERTDIKSKGFPWPGEWTVERDEARQKTTVHWKGKDGYEYPWGTENDFESLTYEGEDAHPETSVGARRGGERLRTEGPHAGLARTSDGDYRSEEFLLQVHAGIIERWRR